MEVAKLAWLEAARRLIGTREVKGPAHNAVIVRWLAALGAWWRDDETPWCGVFLGAVMKEVGIKPPGAYYRARAWLAWGAPLSGPAVGAVAVLERGGAGHVGLVVGRTGAGQILLLGGNQGDMVNVMAFAPGRVLGYRWPDAVAMPVPGKLPVLAAAALSTNEA